MRKYWFAVGIISFAALIIVLILNRQVTEPGKIRIGVLTTLTGPSAQYGQSALNGVLMAVEEINNKGGISGKKIDLIIEDDGGEVSRAVLAFRKLVNINKLPVIIGPISSSASMACSPIANQLKAVLFSPAAATPDFTSPNDYTFRNRISSKFEISELAKFSYQKLNLRNVAILYVNNDWGLGAKEYFDLSFREIGGSILASEAFAEGAIDLRSELAKIKTLEPDGIFVVGQGPEGGYALKQAYELGIKTQFLSALSIQRSDVLEIAGKAANGVIYSAPFYNPTHSKRSEQFERNYLEKFGQNSDLFSGNGYDAAYIISAAIEKGSYTAERIRDVLFTIKNYEGVTGNTSFDENGDVMKPISIKKIENGKFVNFNNSLRAE